MSPIGPSPNRICPQILDSFAPGPSDFDAHENALDIEQLHEYSFNDKSYNERSANGHCTRKVVGAASPRDADFGDPEERRAHSADASGLGAALRPDLLGSRRGIARRRGRDTAAIRSAGLSQ